MIRKTVVMVVMGLSLFLISGAQAGNAGEGKRMCPKSEQSCKKIDKTACGNKVEKGACCPEMAKRCTPEKRAECAAKGAKATAE